MLTPSFICSVAAEAEYSSMQAGVTAGTVLAILVPVVIALGCFFVHLHQQSKENEDAYGYDYDADYYPAARSTDTSIPKKSFSSSAPSASSTIKVGDGPQESQVLHENIQMASAPLQPANSQGSRTHDRLLSKVSSSEVDDDDDDSSSFDGEYETQEPVNNDSVTFQNVLWELPQKNSSSKEAAV